MSYKLRKSAYALLKIKSIQTASNKNNEKEPLWEILPGQVTGRLNQFTVQIVVRFHILGHLVDVNG